MISRVLFRKSTVSLSCLSRSYSATATKGTFKEKSFKEVWLSDTGAYPVMGVIVFACVFATGAGVYFLSGEDARLSKSSRTSIFRGELKAEGYNK